MTASDLAQSWAVLPEVFARLASLEGTLDAGPQGTPRSRVLTGRGSRDIAVVGLYGLLSPRGAFLGGTSLEDTGRTVRRLAADESVAAIVIDADTPGGNVAGATELAAIVRAAREQKPVIAVANHLMASAGYWIGASATEVVASPSARVGSVGVYALHSNIAGALRKKGVEQTIVAAGKHKAEGNELGPLDDEARATIQATVDEAYAAFVSDLAVGRRLSTQTVRTRFGEGRTLSAQHALAAGMVDRIATLDETVARLAHRAVWTQSPHAGAAKGRRAGREPGAGRPGSVRVAPGGTGRAGGPSRPCP